jgi:pimeloyl-ACP methyl ester carboxylesterase
MPYAQVNGVTLYYEVTGDGPPIAFCHEFAGDYRSWQPQVKAFSGAYRCITYSHRGYPPSDVPEDIDAYTQELLVEDLRGLLDHLGIERAHVVGLSMGGNVALNFALTHPDRCLSAVVAGCGAGTVGREQFERDNDRVVAYLHTDGMAAFAEMYAEGAARLTFKRKDRAGWERFRRQLAEHSVIGSALAMAGVIRRRATIFALKERLNQLRVPTLLVVGDEDEPCIEPGIFMKRAIATSGLIILPQSGHTINLEEPERFNHAVGDFHAAVAAGHWATREEVTVSWLPPDARA